MGLTIHYRLSLPAGTPLQYIRQKLGALRQHCLDLPFKEIGELMEFKGEECHYERLSPEDSQRWFLIQAGSVVGYRHEADGKPVVVENLCDAENMRRAVPQHVVGFSAWPGPGCEDANVGLALFSRTVPIRNRRTGKIHRLPVGNNGWRWDSFCKTQYANVAEFGGVENFLRCHLCVIAMLDAAKGLGFLVECSDEGGYWLKRDLKELCQELGQMDQFMAAFGGQLKDAAEASGMSIEGPILERKDFEQLEVKGQERLPKETAALLRELVAMSKERHNQEEERP